MFFLKPTNTNSERNYAALALRRPPVHQSLKQRAGWGKQPRQRVRNRSASLVVGTRSVMKVAFQGAGDRLCK